MGLDKLMDIDLQTIYDRLVKEHINTVVKKHEDVMATNAISGHIKVDATLNADSVNPLQNRIIKAELDKKSDKSHAHDDMYYTEPEIDSILLGKVSKTGDTMSGDLGIPSAKSTMDGSVPYAGSASNSITAFTEMTKYKTYLGAVSNATTKTWYNMISIRHRNGYSDGSNYGMMLYSALTYNEDLYWDKQISESSWQGQRKILDSVNYTDCTVTKTGTGASGTWGINVTGSASKLTTARNINGTAFNGSSNITTALWGTARTITIGNTGKSVDGSDNVTWTISEIGAAPSSHTHPYLPLGGGTMTGNIDYNIYGSSQTPFKVYGGDGNGQGISVGAGGSTIVGSGESAKWLEGQINANDEVLTLASDSYIRFWTNCQEKDISNAVTVYLDASRQFYPATNNSGSIGTSSYKWENMYATTFHGALDGNAASTTKLLTPRSINGTSFNGTVDITTNKWGTARNITIGNTTKSVDGSGNVSWTLAELGAVNKTGDTMSGNLVFPDTSGIVQNQRDTSNYTTIIRWRKGGTSQATYDPQIGHHNTGNEAGAMTLLPYATDADPWMGNVGLYIGKNVLKLDNQIVLHSGNFNGYAPTKTGTGASGTWGINITGNAATASKLATARTITLDGYDSGSATFDGSGNVTINNLGYGAAVYVTTDNTNAPYSRFAYYGTTSSYTDASAIFVIDSGYSGGGYGIVRIVFRAENQSSTASGYIYSNCSAYWLVRAGFSEDQIIVKAYQSKSNNYADIYFKATGHYNAYNIRVLTNGARGIRAKTWIFENGAPRSAMDIRTYNVTANSTTSSAVSWANTAGYVKDSYNGNNINITYGKAGQASTSWLASWNGQELGAISPANITAGKATSLANARAIFGKSFNGTADVAGQALMYGTYTSTPGNRYAQSALQIRENGLVGNAQTDIGYAPSIGFHWGGRCGATLSFGADRIFYFRNQDGTTRATIDANVQGTSTTASKLGRSGDTTLPMTFYWSGQGGQPSWLWGGNDGSNMYVYNPSNFSVNYANSAGTASNLSGFKISTTTNIGIDSTDVNQAMGYVGGLTLATWNNNQTDGAMYRQVYSSAWIHQIFGDYRTGQIAVRGRNNGTWTAWRTVLDSANYNNYAPTKTGTGASGTWGINISGKSVYSDQVAGTYSGNGGAQPPSFISGGRVRFAMMNSLSGLSNFGGYCDCMIMDTYQGSDVPYVTALGIMKSATLRAFIAVGNKGHTSSWNKQAELITTANIGSQSVSYASNSDKLEGYHGSTAASALTYVLRDGNNYVNLNYINSNTGNNENPSISQIIVTNGSDNYYRKASLAHLKNSLGAMPPASHTHSYLPLAGGTMNNGSQIARAGYSTSWVTGRNVALIRTTTDAGYSPVVSCKCTNGSWEMGTYTNNILHFSYITDANYNASNNAQTADIQFLSNGTITAAGFNGNASSASQLATGRTINGTSFNGTGNITTAKWGTARTLTIGNASKSIDGSGNVNYTFDEIFGGNVWTGASIKPGSPVVWSNVSSDPLMYIKAGKVAEVKGVVTFSRTDGGDTTYLTSSEEIIAIDLPEPSGASTESIQYITTSDNNYIIGIFVAKVDSIGSLRIKYYTGKFDKSYYPVSAGWRFHINLTYICR